jgi:Ca2+-binding RTX toxin-like protein
VLIGGKGSDTLYGGDSDDILIDGTTAHDSTSAKLVEIRDQWLLGTTYDERLINVSSLLNADTVFSDGDLDMLFGESGQDWLWAEDSDAATD